jgi:pyruvate formate-lyase activating enzyme-like uncharacterized protein
MAQALAVRTAHMASNEREYGETYRELRWLDADTAPRAESARQEAIAAWGDGVTWACGGTKPHYGPLSPGCAHCVAGTWSCLFVNGVCNARCFFCPTAQDECGEPTTGQIEFARPADYTDYLAKFGFAGASLSGGEPLLTLPRTLEYLRTIRARLGDGVHLWLYTNGLLATKEALQALAEAGLNEIRFNLHASGYQLEPLRWAADCLPTVTVETPAVPEEEERMRGLLPVLADLGVAHVNLHDVRMTPHNVPRILKRNYTCLHGPRVRILESELAALRLLGHAAREQLSLGVQYCCFPYKNPYQTLASRRRWSAFVMRPTETLTETGAIRRCAVEAEPDYIASLVEGWEGAGRPTIAWSVQGRRRNAVHVVPELLRSVDFTRAKVTVSYSSAVTVAVPSYRFLPMKVEVNPNLELTVERRPLGRSQRLDAGQLAAFLQLAGVDAALPGTCSAVNEMLPFEQLSTGLPDYY